MVIRDGNVLDNTILQGLAVIAAANDRSLIEELNRAVETYVLNELATSDKIRRLEAQGQDAA